VFRSPPSGARVVMHGARLGGRAEAEEVRAELGDQEKDRVIWVIWVEGEAGICKTI
jgi:hypothetical protein